MHVHLPKPLHGWREFTGEVGIIVIGVLIALSFEALVEELKWHNKVAEARLQLRHEVGHDLALLDSRISQVHCVDQRLSQLALILTRASASGRLPPIGFISAPGSYTWPQAAWESQLAADTATHFPAQQIGAIGRVYSYIRLVHQINDEERLAWLTLNGMVGPGRPLDAGTVSRLVDAVVVARISNGGFAGMRRGIQRVLVKGGLGSDFPQVDSNNPPVISGRNAVCDPIGRPPAAYGLG
jgi:hypothetical protein